MRPQDFQRLAARARATQRLALRATLQSTNTRRVMQARATGLAGESFVGTEFFQHAGFRSRPLAGAEVIIIPLNGSSAHGVIIASSNGKMFVTEMQEGEAALFNESDGHFVHLKNGKVIAIECGQLNIKASTGVAFDTPTISTTGAVAASGAVSAAGFGGAGGAAASMPAGLTTTQIDAATVQAQNVHATDDVTAGVISLKNHKTSGVQTGTGLSGLPTA